MAVALLGIAVSGGIAIGKARILQHGLLEVVEYSLPPSQIEREVQRFRRALQGAKRQLQAIKQRIPAHTPDDIATFIDTHLLMLGDSALSEAPIELIRRQHCNAEWALKLQTDALVRVFEQMDDAYLKTRRDDVEHVARRIQEILLHNPERPVTESEAGRIVLADDVSPAELVLLHHQRIAGLVTEHGGLDSHTAILARSLGLPALVGVTHSDEYLREDEPLVLDGERGIVLAGLDENHLADYRRQRRARAKQQRQLQNLKSAAAVSADGEIIELQANIELPEDLTAMRRVGVTDVGLFRTEFMFMNRSVLPDEEQQLAALRQTQQRLGGGVLTVRTLDLGLDKTLGSGSAVAGPNPALGLRAIRLCLKDAALFLPHLRAIFRASAHGPIRLLLPMLTSLGELSQALHLIASVKKTLAEAGEPFDPAVPVGAMIEVPAAALCAQAFAERLDFLSIGTNDLIQYTLAADRMDQDVTHLYDPLHPAVLRLINMVVEAGRHAAVPVAMCGEMAGNASLTRLLLGLGLRHFSMPPAAILEVKGVIRDSDVEKLAGETEAILQCTDADAVAERIAALNK